MDERCSGSWLRRVDSNHRFRSQSPASCRWTTPQLRRILAHGELLTGMQTGAGAVSRLARFPLSCDNTIPRAIPKAIESLDERALGVGTANREVRSGSGRRPVFGIRNLLIQRYGDIFCELVPNTDVE